MKITADNRGRNIINIEVVQQFRKRQNQLINVINNLQFQNKSLRDRIFQLQNQRSYDTNFYSPRNQNRPATNYPIQTQSLQNSNLNNLNSNKIYYPVVNTCVSPQSRQNNLASVNVNYSHVKMKSQNISKYGQGWNQSNNTTVQNNQQNNIIKGNEKAKQYLKHNQNNLSSDPHYQINNNLVFQQGIVPQNISKDVGDYRQKLDADKKEKGKDQSHCSILQEKHMIVDGRLQQYKKQNQKKIKGSDQLKQQSGRVRQQSDRMRQCVKQESGGIQQNSLSKKKKPNVQTQHKASTPNRLITNKAYI